MKRLALILGIFATTALAEAPRSVEAKGSVGWAGFEDEDNHVHVGGSVRYYFTPRFSIEPEFQYLRRSNRHYDILLVPNVNWDFRADGRVIPYITGGVGLLRSSFGQFNPRFNSSEGFLQLGAGVKIGISDRWYVAPEFRLGTELHARVSVAIGYRFPR